MSWLRLSSPPRLLIDRVRRSDWFWLLAVTLLVNGVGLGSQRTLTDHEVLLAGTAKTMLETGEWLIPRIGDRVWVEKPPLPQWLAATSAWLLGRCDEWAMRLPFACAGVVVVLLTWKLASKLFGPLVGRLAGVIQATCVYQVTYSRLAEGDVVLQAFVLGALTLFVSGEQAWSQANRVPNRWQRLAFWLLLGGMNLVKGPGFGVTLTGTTCLGWYLLRGDWQGWRRWWSLPGLCAALAISLIWPVWVLLEDPSAAELWTAHSLGRVAGTLGFTEPAWYYLTTWPTQLLPWTPFLLVAIPSNWRSITQNRRVPEAFCWWWVLSHMVLLSCSAGKHHHYWIHGLPALSPIIAQGILSCRSWLRVPQGSRLRASLGFVLLAGVICTSAAWMLKRSWLTWLDALWFTGLLGGVSAWLAWTIYHRQPRRVWQASLWLVVCGHLLTQLMIMPRRDPSAADKQFLAAVARLTPAEKPLIACGSQEIARHLFYVDRPIEGLSEPEEIPRKYPLADAVYVVARASLRDELSRWSRVTTVAQSRYTRRERSPEDRYTLFLLQPHRMARKANALSAHHPDDRSRS